MGATPKMNWSAKGGARSSLQYGGEGVLIHPPHQGVCRLHGTEEQCVTSGGLTGSPGRYYDNMKVVVTSYDGDQPVYNTRFLAFAANVFFNGPSCEVVHEDPKAHFFRPANLLETGICSQCVFESKRAARLNVAVDELLELLP